MTIPEKNGDPTQIRKYFGLTPFCIVKGLMLGGMTKGAALAFLVAGPVTTVPAMVAVTAVVKRRLFLAYIFLSLFGAIAAGHVYQLF